MYIHMEELSQKCKSVYLFTHVHKCTHKEYVAVMISVDSDEQVEVIDEYKD